MRYEPARADRLADRCQTGTLALARAIRVTWPDLACLTPVYGCFNKRPIAGSSRWSLHAEGRAFDVGVGTSTNARAWALACHLVERRTLYGVMRIIWDRHIWSIDGGADWRELGPGTSPHLDHLHVEQFWAAATRPASTQVLYEQSLRLAQA